MQVPTEPPLSSDIPLVHPLLRELHASSASWLATIPLDIAIYYLQPYCGLPCGSVESAGYIGETDPNFTYNCLGYHEYRGLHALQPVDFEFAGFYKTHCGSWVSYGTAYRTSPRNSARKIYGRTKVRVASEAGDRDFVRAPLFQIPEPTLAAQFEYPVDTRCSHMDQAPDGTTVVLHQDNLRAHTILLGYTVWIFDPQYKLVASYTPSIHPPPASRNWRNSPTGQRPRISEMYALCDQQLLFLVTKPYGRSSNHVPVGCMIVNRTLSTPIWFAIPPDHDEWHIRTIAVNPRRSTIYVLFLQASDSVRVYDTAGTYLRSFTVCPKTSEHPLASPLFMLVDDNEDLLILMRNGEVYLYDGMRGNELRIGRIRPDRLLSERLQPRLDQNGCVWSMNMKGTICRHSIEWSVIVSYRHQ